MNRSKERDIDYSPFQGKMPWEKRQAMIEALFPSIQNLDLLQVFRQDPAVMGKIVNDIIKHDQAEPGRPGKRPSLNVKAAEDSLRRYQGEDYNILPFQEAFRKLKGTRSIRHMAHTCDLTSTMVQRLLDGRAEPSIEIMEKVAKGTKKRPSYFQEYRMAFILASLVTCLTFTQSLLSFSSTS